MRVKAAERRLQSVEAQRSGHTGGRGIMKPARYRANVEVMDGSGVEGRSPLSSST